MSPTPDEVIRQQWRKDYEKQLKEEAAARKAAAKKDKPKGKGKK